MTHQNINSRAQRIGRLLVFPITNYHRIRTKKFQPIYFEPQESFLPVGSRFRSHITQQSVAPRNVALEIKKNQIKRQKKYTTRHARLTRSQTKKSLQNSATSTEGSKATSKQGRKGITKYTKPKRNTAQRTKNDGAQPHKHNLADSVTDYISSPSPSQKKPFSRPPPN